VFSSVLKNHRRANMGGKTSRICGKSAIMAGSDARWREGIGGGASAAAARRRGKTSSKTATTTRTRCRQNGKRARRAAVSLMSWHQHHPRTPQRARKIARRR